MDIEDIPVLRHIPMAVGAVKILLILFGFTFTLALSLQCIEGYHHRSYSKEARWYFVLKAVMWGVLTWPAFLVTACLVTGICADHPMPADGNWLYITWFYSKLTGADPYLDYMYNDFIFCFGIAAITYIAALCLGKENSSGAFITHMSHEELLRRDREQK